MSLFLPASEAQKLGLHELLASCRPHTPYGRQCLQAAKPYAPEARACLEAELAGVQDFLEAQRQESPDLPRLLQALLQVRAIPESLKRLRQGQPLSCSELFEVKRNLYAMAAIQALPALLQRQGLALHDLAPYRAMLTIADEGAQSFYLADRYSKKLAKIRKEKHRIEKALQATEEQAELFAQRGKWLALEAAEEAKVLDQLSQALRPAASKLQENLECLGRLDYRLAKANWALQHDAVKPKILDPRKERTAKLRGLRHLLLEKALKKQGEAFHKQTLDLAPGASVLTGPNMGGKSVALQAIFLQLYLAQLGFFVCADALETPLYHFFALYSAHPGELQQGLSSFGMEIVRLKQIASKSQTGPGLVVLDEPFQGTNPQEASALLSALCQVFGEGQSSLLVATHYHVSKGPGIQYYRIRGLKSGAFQAEAPRTEASALADLRDAMDYQVEAVGDAAPPVQAAYQIAKALGLPEPILDRMRQIQDQQALQES